MSTIPLRSLYDDNERYTAEALKIDNEVKRALGAIMLRWFNHGYKIRDLSGLMHGVVNDVECSQLLALAVAKSNKDVDAEIAESAAGVACEREPVEL